MLGKKTEVWSWLWHQGDSVMVLAIWIFLTVESPCISDVGSKKWGTAEGREECCISAAACWVVVAGDFRSGGAAAILAEGSTAIPGLVGHLGFSWSWLLSVICVTWALGGGSGTPVMGSCWSPEYQICWPVGDPVLQEEETDVAPCLALLTTVQCSSWRGVELTGANSLPYAGPLPSPTGH